MLLATLILAGCLIGGDEPDDEGGGGDDGLTEDTGDGWWTDGGDAGDAGDAGDDGGSDDEDSGDWWEDPPEDADGDGWSPEAGDCDDTDDDVHPDADDDDCDGEDQDCDGEADDDFDGDRYEPNDDDGENLGTFGDEGERILQAYIHPEGDEDRFLFYVDDSAYGWFDIELWLYDVPDDADYKLQLVYVEDSDGDYRGIVDTADDGGRGTDELVNYGGSTGFDDSGWYEAVVKSNDGSGCRTPYTLQILVGSW